MSEIVFPTKFPRLESDRLLLRQISPGDSEVVFKNYSDEEIAKNFLDKPFSELEQAQKLIEAFNTEFEAGKAITWAVTLKGTNTCIGTCSYMIESNSTLEVGYDLSKEHWGNGLMSEALRAVIEYGFGKMGASKIMADTMSSNARSINLLKGLGFHLDDVRDNYHFFSLQKVEVNEGGQ